MFCPIYVLSPDVLSLGTFVSQTFFPSGCFVLPDVLFLRTFCPWLLHLWTFCLWTFCLGTLQAPTKYNLLKTWPSKCQEPRHVTRDEVADPFINSWTWHCYEQELCQFCYEQNITVILKIGLRQSQIFLRSIWELLVYSKSTHSLPLSKEKKVKIYFKISLSKGNKITCIKIPNLKGLSSEI